MRKQLFILFLMISSAFLYANAESSESNDYIHLKNGSVITGKIISRDQNKIVFMKNGANKQEELNMANVNFVTHDEPANKYSQSGFKGFVEVGYGWGVGSERNNIFALETSFGYQFNHYLYLGGGLGLHFHKAVLDSYPWRKDEAEINKKRNDPDYKYPFVPLYVNVRSQLFESNRITPFADVKLGASIINLIGLYFSPSIGVHIPTSSFMSLNLSLGYALQQSQYKFWVTGNTPGAQPDKSGKSYIDKDNYISSLNFRVGIEF